MFGTYRFILATMVVVYHLWREVASLTGHYAVFGFFVLSGYLMTRIVKEQYGDGMGGLLRYLANRALRIYPAYLASLALAAVLLAIIPETVHIVSPGARWPATMKDTLAQFTIFGLLHANPRMVPTGWSLDMELVFYVLIGVAFARSRVLTLLWLLLSAEYAIYLMWNDAPWTLWANYWTYAGVSVCFALGATLAYYREKVPESAPRHAVLAVAAFVALAFASTYFVGWGRDKGIYFGALLATLATGALAALPTSGFRPFIRRIDTQLGDLAYPIFLFHLQCAAIVALLLGERPAAPWFFLISLAVTIVVSSLILIFVEGPFHGLRDRVRGRPKLAIA